MPIPILLQGATEGISSIPHAYTVLKVAPWVLLLIALKYYFGGERHKSERLMHSKVVMVTGGTSGIGASVVYELASRGAQIILLTKQAPSDIFLVDYVNDLRTATGNELIYAEQVDLSSLHSIRTFATKWIDNAPPRRLDMIILCASTANPSSASPSSRQTIDGLDEDWQVNYLANFHLLSILSPALRAQPPDRDVRVIFTTCSSYLGAKLSDIHKQLQTVTSSSSGSGSSSQKSAKTKTSKTKSQPPAAPSSSPTSSIFSLSKLSLMIFANSFQKHLNAYPRPDNFPPNARVLIVDPGFTRTPGTRRWLTGGSLWGLLFYLLTWPVWWLCLKSPYQGAQSILYAAMEARYGRGEDGGWMIKECREVEPMGKHKGWIRDEKIGKEVWEGSEVVIQEREKEGAVRRALEKKEREEEQRQSQSQGSEAGSGNGNTASSSSSSSSSTKGPTPGSRRSRKANK